MLKYTNIAALAFVAVIAANAVYAADKVAKQDKQENNAAVTVNGVAIPQSRFDFRIKLAEQQGQSDGPELRRAVKDDLINLEVLTQEAVKKGLNKQEETMQQLALARQSVLAGAFVQHYVKTHPVSEEKLKNEYENLKKHVGNKEYKVAHILVDNEKEAKEIHDELKKNGDKFSEIAKVKTKDPGSKDNGGELGWTVPSNFVPQFGQALSKLSKGQISEPVQTQFGWHVIKLEDTRDLKVPTFDEVKPNMEKRLQQQAIQEAIKELRADADIK